MNESEEILNLENKWMGSWIKKDPSAMCDCMSEDFQLYSVFSKGETVSKEEWINNAMSIFHGISFEFIEPMVRIYGNTAVVTSKFRQDAEIKGKVWKETYFITDVLVKFNDNWKIVSRHASNLQL